MTGSRIERHLPLSGIAAAVLYFVAVFVTRSEPGHDGAHPGAYVDWALTHPQSLLVSGVAGAYFSFFMLLFVIPLRSRIRAGEASEATYSTGVVAGGIGVATSLGFMSLLALALASASSAGDRNSVAALAWLNDVSFITWAGASGVLMLSLGLGGLRTATLPRWLATLTTALGVLSITGPTGTIVFLITPIWLLVVSGVMVRPHHSSRTRPRVPEPTSATGDPAPALGRGDGRT